MQLSLAIDNSLANPSAECTPLAFWRLEWCIFSGLTSRATSSYQSLQPPPSSSSSSPPSSTSPLLPWIHPSHLWKWEAGGGKESERRREGKVRKEGRCVRRWWWWWECSRGKSAGGVAGSVRGKKGASESGEQTRKGARRCFPILRQQIPAEYCQFHYPASKHTFTHRR